MSNQPMYQVVTGRPAPLGMACGPPPSSVMAAPIQSRNLEGIPVVRVENREVPGADRKLTDPGSLVAFLAALFVGTYCIFVAISEGSLGRLNYGVNYAGRLCGADTGLRNMPFLYYPLDPAAKGATTLLARDPTCLRSCPSSDAVAQRATVAVTRTLLDRSEKSSAAMVMEYSVLTPAYVTVEAAGFLCAPQDRALARQFFRAAFTRPINFARMTLGGLLRSWTVVAAVVLLAWLLAALVYVPLFHHGPRALVILSAAAAVIIAFSFGLTLFAAATQSSVTYYNNKPPDPNVTAPSSRVTEVPHVHIPAGCPICPESNARKSEAAAASSTATKEHKSEKQVLRAPSSFFGSLLLMLTGGLLMAGAVFLAALVIRSSEIIAVIARVNEACAEVVASRTGMYGPVASPVILSLVSVSLIFVWILVFLLISTTVDLTSGAIPTPLSKSNPNGGVLILPLERMEVFPGWAVFTVLFWLILGFWVFEFIACLLKFSVCYTATLWYFADDEEQQCEALKCRYPRGRAIAPSVSPGPLSLAIGFTNHAGSFAFAAWGFGLTRFCRAIQAWSSPYYFRCPYANRSCSAHNAQYNPHSVADLLAASAFVETAISSTSILHSLRAASCRRQVHPSVAASMIGVSGLGATLSGLALTLLAGFLCFVTLTQSATYATFTSPHYVYSPLFVSIVAMTVTSVVIFPLIDSRSVAADALLYCYVIESASGIAEGRLFDEDPTYKRHAPMPIRDLIHEELHCDLLGCHM